ncbi:MAG: hypothetical protein M1833_001590 [Piccolia ochrophora]|nr:MAG: hypothetical protein M1833_001590 [Piccolia ochrophora]
MTPLRLRHLLHLLTLIVPALAFPSIRLVTSVPTDHHPATKRQDPQISASMNWTTPALTRHYQRRWWTLTLTTPYLFPSVHDPTPCAITGAEVDDAADPPSTCECEWDDEGQNRCVSDTALISRDPEAGQQREEAKVPVAPERLQLSWWTLPDPAVGLMENHPWLVTPHNLQNAGQDLDGSYQTPSAGMVPKCKEQSVNTVV